MRLAFFSLAAFLICSCSHEVVENPGTPPVPESKALVPFRVTVLDRGANSAMISWTAATNLYNSDTVKYSVVLNRREVVTNLLRTNDTLINLKPDSVYTGKVLAYTKSGDTASATFELEKAIGYVVFADRDGLLNCYNIYNPTRLWQAGKLYTGYKLNGIPTIAKDVVYCASDNQGLWAFNAKTGATIWNTKAGLSGSVGSSLNPLYKDGKVYALLGLKVFSIHSTSGEVEWSYTESTDRYYPINPVIGGNLLFVHALNVQDRIVAIDIRNGTKVWEHKTNYFLCLSPVVYRDLLIYGASDGKIYALNQATGTLAWSRDFSVGYNNFGSNETSPVIYKDLVIVHSGNSGYYGLNALTGATVWNYPQAKKPVSSPAIGNGLVYLSMIASTITKAIALNAATGKQVWERIVTTSAYAQTPVFVKNRLYFSNFTYYSYEMMVLESATGNVLPGLLPNVWQVAPGTIVVEDSTFYVSESGMVQ